MGSRTVEWVFSLPPEGAIDHLRDALEQMNGHPEMVGEHPLLLVAKTPNARHKNRWGATWTINVEPSSAGALARLTVDTTGGHGKLLDDLAGHCGDRVVSRERLPSSFSEIYAEKRANREPRTAAKKARAAKLEETRATPEARDAAKLEERKAAVLAAPVRLDESVNPDDYLKLKSRVKKALDGNLRVDDTVRVIIRGAHGQAMIGTDSRVFVCKPGFMAGASFGAEITSWSYLNLLGVQVHKGLMSGSVLLQGPGQTGVDTSYWGRQKTDPKNAPNAIPVVEDGKGWDRVQASAARLRQLIDEAHAPSAPPSAVSASASLGDELRKLTELHEQGSLTDEEFASAKARLLEK
jgi:hypothetical protein